MKNQIYHLIYIFFASLIFPGCKTIITNLSITENKIPLSFNSSQTDTATIAALNWSQYFSDTLLVKLIDTAISGNIDLQMALQRIESARASVKLVKGATLPQVALNMNGGVRKFGLYTMDGAGNITTEIIPGKIVPINLPDMYVGLNASWEIDIWGKLQNQRKSAFANYLSSIEGTNFVISNLVADVALAYYELIALDNELVIITQTIRQQQEALEVVKLQKDAGRSNELVVQQFHAQLLNSKIYEFEINQKILEQVNLINFLLGRYPKSIERRKENIFFKIPLDISSGLPSQLLSNRPDLREAEFQLQATMFDLKVAKAAFFPNLMITAGIGFQAFNSKFLFVNPASLAYSALGGLVAPLVNRNALKAQFNTAKASQLSAMYNYQKTILNGYVEVVNELSNLDMLQQVISLKQKHSDVLTQSVETAYELYKSGRATYLEVLLIQQNSLQTQLELINVNKRQHFAMVNIYKALGGGWR